DWSRGFVYWAGAGPRWLNRLPAGRARFCARRAARDDAREFAQLVLFGNRQKAARLSRWQNDDASSNRRALRETSEAVNDDGHARQFKKLLRAPAAHARALPRRDDDGNVHKNSDK